jgi:hypothetical protein
MRYFTPPTLSFANLNGVNLSDAALSFVLLDMEIFADIELAVFEEVAQI